MDTTIPRDAAAMRALAAAAAAFERAKAKGYVWIDGDTLFAVDADVPPAPKNPDQLSLV